MNTTQENPKMRLLADRVLIKVNKAEEVKTAGGIIIPMTASEAAALSGKVLKASPMIAQQGEKWDQVEEGDTVLFSKFAGSDLEFRGNDYKVLRITDILSVLDQE